MASGSLDTSSGFPEELMAEILLKLPIKTIVRCTGVCKSWFNLITSPFFITLHVKKSALENEKTRALVRRYKSTCPREYYSLHSDDETYGQYTEFECGFQCFGHFFRIVGICNGLICLSDDQRINFQRIILWNPMIKKAVHLPQPNVVSSTQSLGFGFDPITNDYKVVMIAYRRDYGAPQQFGYRGNEVELYTLSSGTWRNISNLALPLVIGIRRPLSLERQDSPVFMKGAVHWTAYRHNLEKEKRLHYSVVLFDMQLDMFREMPLPEAVAMVDSAETREMSIWECKQMLSIAVHDVYGNFPSCSVWTMKEYGVAETWTKQFDIDIQGMENMRFLRPLGFRKNGELLFENEERYLISYDHEGLPKLKNLQICSSKRFTHRCSLYVDNYTESLVFLNKGPGYAYGEM